MKTSSAERIQRYEKLGWWGDKTLHHILAQTVQAHPATLAVADQPNRFDLTGEEPLRLSYQELDTASDKLAADFISAGVKVDDILIVQLPNIVELVLVYYAASKIGAILSPIPIQYGNHEIQHICQSLQASYFVTINEIKGQSPLEAIKDLNLKPLVFNCSTKNAMTLRIDPQGNSQPLVDYQAKYSQEINDANRIITICWTSGTTGTPKGVPRSHNMWLSTMKSLIEACDSRPGDRLLNPFPLINMAAIAGFLFPAVSVGASLFLHHPLEPGIYLQQLQNEAITFTIAPPALLNMLAKSPESWAQFNLSALRSIGSGSAPLSKDMVDIFCHEYYKPIVNFYGSNEGICLLSTAEYATSSEELATMFPRWGQEGTPWESTFYHDIKTKIVDTVSSQVITTPGMPGELVISGPTVFDGYFNHPNDDVFTTDGYFRTGDMVEICGEGNHFYRIVGRCKDIINRGGIKISPIEIEAALETLPSISEIAICSYPDPILGERICACIVPADTNHLPTLSELSARMMERGMAKFKHPERIKIVSSLPRNAMSKVLRYQLEAMLRETK